MKKVINTSSTPTSDAFDILYCHIVIIECGEPYLECSMDEAAWMNLVWLWQEKVLHILISL